MSIDQEDILGQENEFEDEDTPPAGKKKAVKNGQLMTYGMYAVAVIVVGFAMFKIFGPRFLQSDNQGYAAAPITIDQPAGQGAGQYGYQEQGTSHNLYLPLPCLRRWVSTNRLRVIQRTPKCRIRGRQHPYSLPHPPFSSLLLQSSRLPRCSRKSR